MVLLWRTTIFFLFDVIACQGPAYLLLILFIVIGFYLFIKEIKSLHRLCTLHLFHLCWIPINLWLLIETELELFNDLDIRHLKHISSKLASHFWFIHHLPILLEIDKLLSFLLVSYFLIKLVSVQL